MANLLWLEFEKSGEWLVAIKELEGCSSVPVMSIHKSKGLEFDTVILLGLEDSEFWGYSTNQEEETNVFFVAISRAKRRLVLTYSGQKRFTNGPSNRSAIETLYTLLDNSGVVVYDDLS